MKTRGPIIIELYVLLMTQAVKLCLSKTLGDFSQGFVLKTGQFDRKDFTTMQHEVAIHLLAKKKKHTVFI